MTEVGLSVLFKEQLMLVEEQSIGLITNQTGIGPQFQSNLTLFVEHPRVQLAALFSPEHGISGSAQAGIQIASAIGKGRQIPIHSLYGRTRQPTPEMLAGIDTLIYDIQDVGSRFYTYISTLLRSIKPLQPTMWALSSLTVQIRSVAIALKAICSSRRSNPLLERWRFQSGTA